MTSGWRISSGSARTRALIVAVVVATATIVVAVDLVFERSVSAALERDSQRAAQRWADVLAGEIPGLDLVAAEAGPAPDRGDALAAAASRAVHLDVALFDAQGRPSPPAGAPTGPAEPLALRAIETGERVVTLIDGGVRPGHPDRHAVAYLPRRGPDGQVVGAVEVSIDQPAQHKSITRTFRLLGVGLPILCAVLFLVPAIAVLLGAERARRSEVAVARLARVDPLTGTLNRASLQDALAKALLRSAERGESVGLLAVDVDRLKDLNDEHGAPAGDQYLRRVADLLRRNLRDGDAVGRMAGDMFVAVLPDIDPRRLDAIARDIHREAGAHGDGAGRPVGGSVSIGRHVAAGGDGPVRALRAAELAMRQAKIQGRDRVVAYAPSFDAEDRRHRAIARALRGAWASGRMTLNFQPLVSTADGGILGYEALLRLRAPDGSSISPAEFIPVAEQTGLIHQLGLETLERALRVAADWPEDRFLSVNLSPEQFRRADLVDRIAEALARTGFPPARLELEVTESLLIGEEEQVADQLVRLKALGVALALDDFGTGYSSLGYLFKFSFDKLKIDRIFLEGYSFDSPKHREIVEIIVLLGHKLGLKVVAEGVETEAQRDMLARLSCDQLQGFLFGRPVPAEQIELAPRRSPSAA